MSGIAGIYNLDGKPVDTGLLHRMTDVIAHRGPDGGGYWIDSSVGLGQRMLHTTPESLHEKQPMADEIAELCLTMDGRIDNRDELRTALESRGFRLRTDTDAEIVLCAYQCWGEECPARILGDFALAVWDGKKRQLFCARDIHGIKPFYYHSDGSTFTFASELHALFENENIPREPNEGMIGEYLAVAITDREETLYEHIFRLPPAHAMVVRADRIQKRQYWDVDLSAQIRYRSDAEYVDHFRAIFNEAIRCRLRSHRPVGSHLSGGLDSSAVTATAHRLYGGRASGVETFSLMYPGLPCDESVYIQQVVDDLGVKSNPVFWVESEPLYFVQLAARYRDFPGYPNNDPAWGYLAQSARQKGCGVLLTGWGGNEWLEGSRFHLADLLRGFEFRELIRQLKHDSELLFGSPSRISLLIRNGMKPLVPGLAAHTLRRLRRRKHPVPWINQTFARRIGLIDRLRKQGQTKHFSSIAQRDIYLSAFSGSQVHGYEIGDRSTSSAGIENRHPFHDRRIVEFALAIPEEQRWRGDEVKFVLLKAMAGRLPPSVLQRRNQGDFTVLYKKALESPAGQRCFAHRTTASPSLDWIDQEYVDKAYTQITRGYAEAHSQSAYHARALWMIYGTETWFESAFAVPQPRFARSKERILNQNDRRVSYEKIH